MARLVNCQCILLIILTFVYAYKVWGDSLTVFYKNYCKLCAFKGVSVSGAANAIGLSNAAANGWKKGKIPQDTTLVKLADYFGVPVSDLTEEKEKSPTPDGVELSKERIKEMLNQMSAADLAQIIADCADEMRKRNANNDK